MRGDPVKNQIGDFFVMELLKRGYTPVERAQVQASDVASDEDAAKAGRVLNVPAVLLVNIPTFKEEINMTAKIVSVEDGGIL